MTKIFKHIYHTAVAIALVATAQSLTSCDEHRDFLDTATKPGHVLCTDGKVMSLSDYEKSGKNAIAVVFHVNQDTNVDGEGYAVYLWDVNDVAFSDTLGISQGTSADVTAMDGNMNTYAMYGTKDAHSPLAEAVFDIWHNGQSAYVPSVAQMRLLYHACSTINPIIEKLGGTPIPKDEAQGWYWTSTEVRSQQPDKAWLYSMTSGAMLETPKTQAHKARPIITMHQ